MKKPKTIKRLCPYCKVHTEHMVGKSKQTTRGKANPLSTGTKCRSKKRDRGFISVGKHGRTSRMQITQRKRDVKNTSKKTDIRYIWQTCKKQHTQESGIRTKKFETV